MKIQPEPRATLAFQSVEYWIGSNPIRKILHDLSTVISAGETVVLLGRSGSGKTTLLKLINRLLLPKSGTVIVNGRSTRQWDPIELRRKLGYVIQDAGLFPHYTVAENVGLVPWLEHWDADRRAERIVEMLRLVGLDPEEFANRRPNQLSGGQRQRVGVARALAVDPPILLMDEPFGSLDPVTRSELQREFASLVKRMRKTILFVTHDLREALFLGSRILLLDQGRIVADAPPRDFAGLDHPEVKAFTSSLDDPLPQGAS